MCHTTEMLPGECQVAMEMATDGLAAKERWRPVFINNIVYRLIHER